MQACDDLAGCNSFALCATGPQGCWLKDKVVSMSDAEGTQSPDRACKTYKKGSLQNKDSLMSPAPAGGWEAKALVLIKRLPRSRIPCLPGAVP